MRRGYMRCIRYPKYATYSSFWKRNCPGLNETLEIEMLRKQVCGDLPGISSAIVSATASAAAAVHTRDPTVPQDYPPCAVSIPESNSCQYDIRSEILTRK